MTNPGKGTKVKSTGGDEKHEYAGPIASDSLAADSLRSGGHFAQGNPADISSVTGSRGTFASHPEPSGPHYQEIPAGHKKGDQDVFETGRAGGVDDDVKIMSGHYAGRRGDVEQHRAGKVDDAEHPKLGLRGGMAPGEEARGQHGLNSSKYAPSTSTHDVGTVGLEAVKQKQTPDWSKISKDFEPTTNIGSDEDPGRLAEQRSAKMATRQYSGTNKQDQPGEPQRFDRGTVGTVPTTENAYQGLNSEETI